MPSERPQKLWVKVEPLWQVLRWELLLFKVFVALALRVCHIHRGFSTVTSSLWWRSFIVPTTQKSQRRTSFYLPAVTSVFLFKKSATSANFSSSSDSKYFVKFFFYLRAGTTVKFCRMLTHQLDWLMRTLGGSQKKDQAFRKLNFHHIDCFIGCELFQRMVGWETLKPKEKWRHFLRLCTMKPKSCMFHLIKKYAFNDILSDVDSICNGPETSERIFHQICPFV